MKLGFVSMPVTGHLNPMTALARKLQSCGNEVVFIGLPDAEPIVRAANLTQLRESSMGNECSLRFRSILRTCFKLGPISMLW
jgi:UDP:flavonoid glycosyltransferase YjiC (YdhE family)